MLGEQKTSHVAGLLYSFRVLESWGECNGELAQQWSGEGFKLTLNLPLAELCKAGRWLGIAFTLSKAAGNLDAFLEQHLLHRLSLPKACDVIEKTVD